MTRWMNEISIVRQHAMLAEHDTVLPILKGSVKEPNMFHNYETEKLARKASDAAENLQ